jgi:hypothetical protein
MNAHGDLRQYMLYPLELSPQSIHPGTFLLTFNFPPLKLKNNLYLKL